MGTSANNSQIQNELTSLKSELNAYLSAELQCIIQPEYRTKNKAHQLLDMLNKLVSPVAYLLDHPEFIHDTKLDDGLNEQRAVMNQLEKDYPNDEMHKTFEEAHAHLKAAYDLIKKLRQEIPRSTGKEETKH